MQEQKLTYLLARFNPAERKKIRAYQRLFAKDNPDAQVVLKDFIRAGHIFESVYSSVGGEMMLAEGERNFVLRILTILNLSPEEIVERSHLGEQEQEVTDNV